MKPDQFKKLISEAVKDAFNESLKDVLLEALKTNKQPIIEHVHQPVKPANKPSTNNSNFDVAEWMKNNPSPLANMPRIPDENPTGEVPLDVIFNLTK